VCGRYAATKNPAKLAAEFDAVDTTGDEAPSPDFNVAPTKPVLAVVTRHPRDAEGVADPARTERDIRVMRWGLVPHWAKSKSVGSKMINARADTAGSKPAFRTSLAKRRCLMPAAGWFEWRRDATGRQPFFMTRTDGASLAMAGLWTTWRDPAAEEGTAPLVTCAVLTTDAVGQLAGVHDRMPLLLRPEDWATWLDPDDPDVERLLVPPAQDLVDALELRPVSDAVNSVRNNGPNLVDEVTPITSLDEPTLFDVTDAAARG
jgi:putative SOS response-associated peptidase YedK